MNDELYSTAVFDHGRPTLSSFSSGDILALEKYGAVRALTSGGRGVGNCTAPFTPE